MENFKNTREDKDLFPYEYGAAETNEGDMAKNILSLFSREDLKSHFALIWKHTTEMLVPGTNSHKRKVIVYLANYMNYRIRHRRTNHSGMGDYLIKDDKFRKLLEPIAKIICLERDKLDKWKKENPNGYGEYKYLDGSIYEGDWKNGEYHGNGKYFYPEGASYKGKLKNWDEFDEGTIMNFSNGKYEGDWKNGKMEGQGILTYSNGDKYEGEWKNGYMWNGKGTGIFSDVVKYEGDWKNGEYHGHGTFTYSGGEKYEGEWKNDQMNGHGIFTRSDGIKHVGEWKNGKEWNTKIYNKGKLIEKYVNGEKQK